jgi:hypothetical protein
MVKIKFREYDQRVLPEMGAKITFLAAGSSVRPAEIQPVLTVPEAAIATRDGRQVVYQVKEGEAVEIPVSTGKKIGNLVEVTAGLKESDKVIAKVDERVHAGTRVSLAQK